MSEDVERRSKLESHGIYNKKEYNAAIDRQSHLTRAQKAALKEAPQIPTYDRGWVSPLGGLARPDPRFQGKPK